MTSDTANVVPFAAGHRPEDVAVLAKHSFLAGLSAQDLGALVGLLDQVALAPGMVVFREGERGDHMYFVLEGHARLSRGIREVARVGPGDHFGEVAILAPHTRTSTVFTESTVRLARLARTRFQSLGEKHPRAALHFVEALAASVAATMTALSDDVGLIVQRRSLPRRSMLRVNVSGRATEIGTGTLVGTLLPTAVDGAQVVAALSDRRAVSLETPLASDAAIEPLTTASWEGRRVFRRSAMLLVMEAARRARPDLVLTASSRFGRFQLVIASTPIGHDDVAAIQQRVDDLIARAAPLREEVWTVEEARTRFLEQGWADAAALLASYSSVTVSLLACDNTLSLSLGPVVPSASELSGVQVHRTAGGLLVDFGPRLYGGKSSSGVTTIIPTISLPGEAKTPARTMSDELGAWLGAMNVTSVGRFNEACVNGQVDELVRVSEGFHEKNIVQIADAVSERRVRVVAIAGPSSSGKTTFIRRLKVQLEVNGIIPVHLSLDDYYVDRERTPQDEHGELDFESVDAIDHDLLRAQVSRLIAGESVQLARFDFPSGKSLPAGGDVVKLTSTNILLVEGLHALNPRIAHAEDPTVRVFVHPATALPLDRVSAVLPEDVRLLRRIVRDRHGRGYTALDTIKRWPSVRRGEERHIFPFAAAADFTFDTSLVYEVAVLRVFAERYLLEIPTTAPELVTATRLRQLIERFVPIYPDHVPPTSILREFIGGGFGA